MEPYGASNPQPVFGAFGLRIISVTPLSEGRHVRLELEKKGKRIKVVKFSTPYDEFPYKAGDTVNLAVKITRNFYKEKSYLSIQAIDIHLSSVDEEKYFKEKNDYEHFMLTKNGISTLYPDRERCAVLYRFLKTEGGFKYNTDELYFRVQDKMNYAQLIFALSAFKQAGLIDTESGMIKLLPADSKVNLQETEILKTVRERLGIG